MRSYIILAVVVLVVMAVNTLILQKVTCEAIARHNQGDNKAIKVVSVIGVRG